MEGGRWRKKKKIKSTSLISESFYTDLVDLFLTLSSTWKTTFYGQSVRNGTETSRPMPRPWRPHRFTCPLEGSLSPAQMSCLLKVQQESHSLFPGMKSASSRSKNLAFSECGYKAKKQTKFVESLRGTGLDKKRLLTCMHIQYLFLCPIEFLNRSVYSVESQSLRDS